MDDDGLPAPEAALVALMKNSYVCSARIQPCEAYPASLPEDARQLQARFHVALLAALVYDFGELHWLNSQLPPWLAHCVPFPCSHHL
jgi:hypothetical protein